LHVPVVVLTLSLSKGKDPEGLDDPLPLRTLPTKISTVVPSQPTLKNRHFDRSWSRSHREQRSAEIRFSASTVRQLVQHSCRCGCLFSSSQNQSIILSTEVFASAFVFGIERSFSPTKNTAKYKGL
jgi:hypothetical protein